MVRKKFVLEPKEFWLKKAEEFKKLKKVDEALECLEKVREIDDAKNKPYFWYKKGIAYSEMEEFDKALRCFDKDLEINKLNFETLYQKGIVLYLLKKNLDAIECFNKAWELKYSNYLKTKEQIHTLKEHKEFEKALMHSTKLDQMKSLPYQFWHYKALALTDLGKHQDAIKCYDEALSIKPDEPLVLFDKARCELLRGKENNCIPLLIKACKLDMSIKNMIKKEKIFSNFSAVFSFLPFDS